MRDETLMQIAGCVRLHLSFEDARVKLLHECYLQEIAFRRLDSRVSVVAHLPLRHRRKRWAGSPLPQQRTVEEPEHPPLVLVRDRRECARVAARPYLPQGLGRAC